MGTAELRQRLRERLTPAFAEARLLVRYPAIAAAFGESQVTRVCQAIRHAAAGTLLAFGLPRSGLSRVVPRFEFPFSTQAAIRCMWDIGRPRLDGVGGR